MSLNHYVSIHTYFNISPSFFFKKKINVACCSLSDKIHYMKCLTQLLFQSDQYGYPAKYADMMSDYFNKVKQMSSYEEFCLTSQLDIENSDYLVLAAFYVKKEWLNRLFVEDCKTLNKIAHDKDFSKLIEYTMQCEV